MWFRGRRRRPVRTPFDYDRLPAARFHSIDEAAEEGVMLARRAGRMYVKNRILIGALTGTAPFDEAHYRGVARAALERLSNEAEAGAERITELKEKLATGAAATVDVERYSADDIANMRHRASTSHSVARQLAELSQNEEYLDALVEGARVAAWGEIAAAIEATLSAQFAPVDENYARDRAQRLQRFIDIDLAELIAR